MMNFLDSWLLKMILLFPHAQWSQSHRQDVIVTHDTIDICVLSQCLSVSPLTLFLDSRVTVRASCSARRLLQTERSRHVTRPNIGVTPPNICPWLGRGYRGY